MSSRLLFSRRRRGRRLLCGLAAAAGLAGLVVASLDAGTPGSAQAGQTKAGGAAVRAKLTAATSSHGRIAISKVADRSQVSAGDPIGYEITVTDHGRSTAKAVTMTDTLPSNTGTSWTVGKVTGKWACAIKTGKLTCGGVTTTVDSGDHLSVHVTSTTSTGTCGPVTNTATVSTSNEGSASATAKIEVECARIELTKVPDRSTVAAGDPVGYEITVTNREAGTAHGVTMTDPLPTSPAGLTWGFGSVSPGWTCHVSTGTLTCGGSSTTLSHGAGLHVHITSGTTGASCGTIDNTAHVATSNDGSDSASGRIVVECAAIEVTKVADKSVVSEGESIGYEITVSNHGTATARGVTMTDLLPTTPPGLSWTFGSVSPGWTCATNLGTLTCGGSTTTLKHGDSLHVHISSGTRSFDCGRVTNTAHVSTSNDGSATTKPEHIDVLCARIKVIKTADAPVVDAGHQIGYEITVINDGPGTVHGVLLSDSLLGAGTTWAVDSHSTDWACHLAVSNLTCGGATTSIAPGDHLKVHVISPTTTATCGILHNNAHVDASNAGSQTATASIDVRCAKIQITKVPDATSVSAGDAVGYTITVTNTGTGSADGVVMTDPLPTKPSGLSWSFGLVSPGWSCGIASDLLTCGGSSTTLAHGASLSVHVSATTTSSTCGKVENEAHVSTSNDGSEVVSASVEVLCPRIQITKTPDAHTVSAGDPIGYTITVTNGGAGIAHDVTMTDTLPTTSGLTWSFGSVSAGWSCAISGGVLTCGGAGTDLAASASLSVHIASPTTGKSCGLVHNVATVSTSNDKTARTAASIIVLCANIAITKTADKPLVNAGDPIGYEITVSNRGIGTAHGVTMTDTLPTTTGTSWTVGTHSAGWSCAITAGVLTCGGTTTSLGRGDSLRVHVTSPTTGASCGKVENTAKVKTSNDGADSARAFIEVLCARIEISKVADKSVVSAGDPIGYEITVTNRGIGTAHGVTMTDTLPTTAGTSWTVGTHSAGWSCSISVGGVLTCGGSSTTLGFGGRLQVHITSTTDKTSCGKVTNTAAVATANDGSAKATARIEVLCARIAIRKVADSSVVTAGDQIGYQITVSNLGFGTAHGVVMTDTLPTTPSGLAWTIDTHSAGWTCGISSNVLTCTGSATGLAAGGSLHVHIVSPTTAESCGLVHNTAHVATTNDGSATTTTARIAVLCAHIKITKVADESPVSAGDPIGYTITVSNHGAGTARGVTMTDTLPTTTGTSWTVGTHSAGWSCAITAGVLTCGGSTTTLGAGGSLDVHVTSPTTSASCGLVPNTASVTTGNDGSGTAHATVDVLCARIEISKKANVSPVSAGDPIGYTITVHNAGAGTARDVTMKDTLPTTPGLVWTIASHSAGWSCAIATGVLTCGGSGTSLASGGSLDVHITSPTTSASCGLIKNTAAVTTANDGSGSATAVIVVLCPKIEITKTADQSPVPVGGSIGYLITVTNGGAGTARDVTMTDPLPPVGTAWTVLARSPGWRCAILGRTLVCGGKGTSLAFRASLRVHVVTPTTRAVCGPVINIARVTTSNDGTGRATALVEVVCPNLPSISTQVSKRVISQGGSLTDTATLTGAGGTVTGTVDFQLCSGTTTGCPKGDGAAFDTGVPLVNGVATSSAFGFHLRPGNYCVGLAYHPDGKSPYAFAYSGTATGECFTVRKHHAHALITTHLSRNRIHVGGLVRDLARLHGVSKPVRGVVVYRVYRTLRGCRADTAAWPAKPRHGFRAGVAVVRGLLVHPSRWIRFRRPGAYYWAAFYAGGPRNGSAASRCLTEVLKVSRPRSRSAITTWLSRHLISPGQAVLDWATVHTATRVVTGLVQFRFYSTLAGCRADTSAWPGRPRHGVFVDRLPVRGHRTADTRLVTFRRAGVYYWAAFYSGGARNAPAASKCLTEILKVS